MRDRKPTDGGREDLFLRLTALQLICCVLIFALVFGAMRLNGDLFDRFRAEFSSLTAADYDVGGYRFFDFGSAGEKRENTERTTAPEDNESVAETAQTETPGEAETEAATDLPAEDTAEASAEESDPQADTPAAAFYDEVEVVMPVNGTVTSGYGARVHPIYGTESFHSGKDLAVPAGTPIYAAMDGTVVAAGWGDTSGYFVKLGHENGMETFYCHMREVNVEAGVSVRRGDVIGFVGHFEVRIDGEAVDPDIVLREAVVVS